MNPLLSSSSQTVYRFEPDLKIWYSRRFNFVLKRPFPA